MDTIQSIEQLPPLPVVNDVEIRHCHKLPGYCVGDDGSAWSCNGHYQIKPWTRIGVTPKKCGYHYAYPSVGGRKRGVKVAAMVCEAFHGPRPPGMYVLHGNGNPGDNRKDNLRWGTQRDNIRDAIRHGTFCRRPRGECNPQSKLSNADVSCIRSLADAMSRTALAKMFGVTQQFIGQIICGKRRTI